MNEDGWFPAVDGRIRDDDGRPTGTSNVLGRFDDHQRIDGAASKAAGKRKNIYRIGIRLRERILVSAMGAASMDEAPRIIKFAEYPEEAAAAIQRFPEAWKHYQKRRQAPRNEGAQVGENDVLEMIGFDEPAPAPVKKRGRKPKSGVVVQMPINAA